MFICDGMPFDMIFGVRNIEEVFLMVCGADNGTECTEFCAQDGFNAFLWPPTDMVGLWDVCLGPFDRMDGSAQDDGGVDT